MNDREARKHQARFERELQRWVPRLGLEHWLLEIDWKREALPPAGDYEGAAASVRTLWEYQRAVITVDLSYVAQCSPLALSEVALHELVHVLLDELRPPDSEISTDHHQHHEHVTTLVTSALLRSAGIPTP